jgi:flagellin
MSLRINNNVEAMDTLRNLQSAQSMFSTSMSRLSSGKRINSAADDAAGYAISNKLLAQTKGLDQAAANAQDGISLVQTANGGLQTTQTLLQRMRQLAVQSANDTNTSSDRQALQGEANQITQEITQIASTTQFNTKNLLDGSAGTVGALNGGTSFALLGNFNGAALGAGNAPVVNTGNLAANDLTGAQVSYTFTQTTAGIAGTVGDTGKTALTDDSVVVGDGTSGMVSYSGGAATQKGVVAGSYNMTIGGGSGAVTISVASTDKFSDVVDKVNAVSAQTGVSAVFASDKKGITLTNNTAGSTQTVSATGQAQLLRGLGLMGQDTTAYLNTTQQTAAEQQIVTASGVGTDGVATLKGGTLPGAGVTLKADGNNFSDSGTGFSFNLNSVQGLAAGNGKTATFNVNTAGTVNLQVGANANQNLTVNIGDMRASALGIASGNGAIDITTQASANNAIKTIDAAIQQVSTQAASLGAVQNRLTAAISNLQIGSENMTAAYSAITNVNMAQESTNLATAQILQQSSTAMLAQANQAPQGVLKLLG